MNDFINYYELLGVKNNASKEEIRLKYKEQIKKWHPDINKNNQLELNFSKYYELYGIVIKPNNFWSQL